jgi:hypothetical protein
MSKTVDPQLRADRTLLDLLADKWTILVLGVLCDNEKRSRFNAIKRQIPGISQKVSRSACGGWSEADSSSAELSPPHRSA